MKTKVEADTNGYLSAPAMSTDARQNQMIALAMDQAEKQMREGTASSQVITHFLKLATVKEEKELLKLEMETELLKAKTEAVKSAKHVEEMYADAIAAMRRYSGGSDEENI